MHRRMRGMKLDADALLGDYQELLIEYFRIFGNKKCCTNDLKMFLEFLDVPRRSDFAAKLLQDTGITSTTLPQNVSCHFLIFLKVMVFLTEGSASKAHLFTSNFTILRCSFIAFG